MEFVDGPTSQVFGANPQFSWQPWGHLGEDKAVPVGTPGRVIADGVVIFADWGSKLGGKLADEMMMVRNSPASGICVIVQHDGWRSMIAHLDSTHLNKGQKVKRGQTTCLTGNTGNSTGPHAHVEVFLAPSPNTAPFGRYNPRLQIAHEDEVAALAAAAAAAAKPVIPATTPTQRRVIAGGVNELSAPSTQTGKVLRTFPAGEVLNFKGYVIGERVDGMNGWLVGAHSGKYFHVGRFTQRDVKGLPNLTPAPAKPANWRKTGTAAAAYRELPYLGDDVEVRQYLKPGIEYVIDAWTTGDEWEDSNVWFSVKGSDGWTNAKLFTSQSTTGIPKVAAPARPQPAPAPVVPAPKPTPTPVEPPYTFTKAVPCVTGVYPAARNKFAVGNKHNTRNPSPDLFLHQFATATKEENPDVNRETVHIGSLRNTFTQEDDRVASVFFAVEKQEVDQYVSLDDRAYHGGPVGNDFWAIEIYGGMDAETLATVAKLIRELQDRFGVTFNLRRHDEVMSTDCGRHVDLDLIRSLVAPAPVPAPEPEPVDLRGILIDYETHNIDAYLAARK